MMVIVPNILRDAINTALDEQLKEFPEASVDIETREYLYSELLAFYNENGYIPEFRFTKNEVSNDRA